MSATTVGRVVAIAIKSGTNGPMQEVPQAAVVVDGGVVGDVPNSGDRGVTFLSSRQWAAVQGELGSAAPWHTRRANVLIEADSLAPLVGCELALGEARIIIKGETKPCGLMDKLLPGLREALKPDFRGGVHGRVVQAGAFKVGDALRVVENAAPA